MKNPDQIYKLAEELVTKYQDRKLANANEATTRFHIIDVILNEILEWNKDDIEVEETHHDENGTARYCDYIIRTANTAIIVEAKKVGVAFDTVPQKRKQRLRGAWLEGSTGDAIRQAKQYCIDKNIQFAVVTNGGQWIISPAFRDDEISFKDSNAIIFDSLQQTLGEDLNYFTSLLSREGVINGYLREELLGRKEDQIETRRLNSFKLTDIQRPENPIYPLIEEEITQAFSDTSTADRETLINCYVQTPDRKRFDTKIQFHINKRDSLFRVAPKNPMKRKQRGALDSALSKTTKSAKPLAMLILGTVGSGKSTFLKYTREVSAADFFAKKVSKPYPHWIDINFLEFSPSGNVLDFIYESVYKYIESDEFLSDYDLCQKYAYAKDIESMKRGPLKRLLEDERELNREIARKILNEQEKVVPYVEKILEWSATKSPVFLVVDNVDQMPDEDLQSTIFADAIALASKLGINLLLSMRESTYVQHRNSPTFDAFDFDTLQIDPPDIHAVLSKDSPLPANY